MSWLLPSYIRQELDFILDLGESKPRWSQVTCGMRLLRGATWAMNKNPLLFRVYTTNLCVGIIVYQIIRIPITRLLLREVLVNLMMWETFLRVFFSKNSYPALFTGESALDCVGWSGVACGPQCFFWTSMVTILAVPDTVGSFTFGTSIVARWSRWSGWPFFGGHLDISCWTDLQFGVTRMFKSQKSGSQWSKRSLLFGGSCSSPKQPWHWRE